MLKIINLCKGFNINNIVEKVLVLSYKKRVWTKILNVC